MKSDSVVGTVQEFIDISNSINLPPAGHSPVVDVSTEVIVS